MHLRRTIVAALLVTLVACGSARSRTASSPDTVDGSPTSTTSTDSPTVPGSIVRADPAVCAAFRSVSAERGNPSVGDLTAMAAVAPPELDAAVQDLLGAAQQVAADPNATDHLRPDVVVSIVHDQQTIQDWYRRSCGPPTAASAWCESFTSAEFTRALALVELDNAVRTPATSLPRNPGGPGLANEIELSFFQSIVGAAPSDLQPQVQLVLDQFESNGGRPPLDATSRAARDTADAAIVGSVLNQCGLTVSPGDL